MAKPRPFIDLVNPPASLANDLLALQTAFELNSAPALNLDGEPLRFSWLELQASLANPSVTATAKQTLQRVAIAFFDPAEPRPAPTPGLPPERAAVRNELLRRGLQVFSDPYPPDLPVPSAVRALHMRMPFPAGTAISVQQGNNTMFSPSSHGPTSLRYAVDFVLADSPDSTGTLVSAPAGGTAYVYGNGRPDQGDNWGFGNFVLIDHGNGYATLMAHLEKSLVKTGDTVVPGQDIGQIGNTGLAGNPHLHLQVVHLSGQPDPKTQEYHAALGQLPKNFPIPPFDAIVPFEMPLIEVGQSALAPERTFASTELRGGEASMLPEYAGTYLVPQAQPVSVGEATTTPSATGASIRSYPGSEALVQRMETLLKGLSKSPNFRSFIQKATVLISPPGQGLEAVFGPGYDMEGFASHQGFDGTQPNTPVLAIRSDSLGSWYLGAAHELIHLVEADKGPGVSAKLAQVFEAEGFKRGQPDGYPNPAEMFAYFGQWYLAGFGEELKTRSPALYALCREYLGAARIDPEQITATAAGASLDSLIAWFKSGQHRPA
jgi:hypothetical protein